MLISSTMSAPPDLLHNYSTSAPESVVNISEEAANQLLQFLKTTYSWLIPIMIIILLIAIFGNGVIVLSSPWMSSPVSPYLKLCISLAAADMWAAFLLITGLIVNSYMPVVLEFSTKSNCLFAWLEMFRISGMLTSDLHLFALGINQFVGTKWPLKYKIMVTTRRMRYIIIALWLVPLCFVSSWFMSNESDGLRHPECRFVFYEKFPFRVTIFLTFMIPLLATLFIYGMILINLLKAKAEFEMCTAESQLTNNNSRRSNVHSKLKLVWTTLLIVSTFSLSWGLCVLYFVLVCKEGCVFTYLVDVDFYLGLFLSSSVQMLVMLKLASNPFIYTLRIKAIRASVDSLFNVVCRKRTYPGPKASKTGVALLHSGSATNNSV